MLAWGSIDAPDAGFSDLAARKVDEEKERRAWQKRHVIGLRARPDRARSSRRDAIVLRRADDPLTQRPLLVEIRIGNNLSRVPVSGFVPDRSQN